MIDRAADEGRYRRAAVSRRALLGGASLLMLMHAGGVRAQGAKSGLSDRSTLDLNGTWHFSLARDADQVAALADFHKPAFDTSRFVPVPVPSNWAVLGFEEPQYGNFNDRPASEGFYIRRFDVPTSWKDKRVLIHFNGVWASAEVWLNGVALGRHDSGFTSFGYDMSAAMKPGEANILAVRVRQVYRDYLFDANDDWALGGIFGDVWIETMPKLRWLDTVQIETVFDDTFRDADLKVRVMVGDAHPSSGPGNYMWPGDGYTLRLSLVDAGGRPIDMHSIPVASHYTSSREVRTTFRARAPLHWNAEQPNLYRLDIDLIEKGVVTQTRRERFGFRQISTAGGVFRINGQAVKLRGVNRHEEHPDVGRATRREHWLQDLSLMKAANINYVRCAHYPPAPGFLDLCDELGMYVGNEIPMGGPQMNDPAVVQSAMLRTYEGVTRDINHPSVVYWSIGNEDPLTSLHLAAIRATKALDPTRPVLIPWRADDWLPPEIDILAPHYWQPSEYDALAGRATRPVISTEYTHAYGPQGLGSLKERWQAITRHPAGAGAAIWMWADQGLATKAPALSVSKQPGLRLTEQGWDGITDAYRTPTRDYWEAKAVYAQVYPEIEQVAFVLGQGVVQIPIRNDFDFTDLRTVTIEWQIREDDRTLATGRGSIAGQPHAGALFALPLGGITQIRPGAAYYACFVFRDQKGAEITRRSVELLNEEGAAPPRPAPAAVTVAPGAVAPDRITAIRVGEVEYRFSAATGMLAGASVNGRAAIDALQPSLWRTPDDNERYIGGEKFANLPDLNRATATAREWQVRNEADAVRIHAVVDHVVDAKNRYVGTYDYVVTADGRLEVLYAFEPVVETPWLLQVGMLVRAATPPVGLRWFGLGPLDAYPNKQAAPYLGLWSGAAGSAEVTGVKKARWAELAGAGGTRIRAIGDGYIFSEAAAPGTLHILSSVLGRPEKGRQPIAPVPQLTTQRGSRFVGTFRIALTA